MGIRNTAALAAAGMLVLAAMPAIGGEVIRQQEYDKYVDKHRTLQALDSSLFGEQINLRDGGVVFRVTDGELLGNGPPIRIVRSFKLRANNRLAEVTGTSLAIGWMLEVPRLKNLTNNSIHTLDKSVTGWQVPASGTGLYKDQRCTYFDSPGLLDFTEFQREWAPYEWWSGYQLVDGEGNEQQMLRVESYYNPQPDSVHAVTTGNWRFECLSATANGQPGEGFKGTAPDGTKYFFDYLVYTNADDISKPYGSMPQLAAAQESESMSRDASASRESVTSLAAGKELLSRRYAMLLVTRIEDRFGNFLTYSYDAAGKLAGITASDGRQLTVSSTFPTKITLAPGTTAARTWTYATDGTTDTVTLPDGSAWSYGF